jgi:YfiH family protein
MPDPDCRQWLLEAVDGVTLARCNPLVGLGGLAHAFSTRRAEGTGDFDLGPPDCDEPLVEERRRRFSAAAGLEGRPPLILRQLHGSQIVRPGAGHGSDPPEADGILLLREEDTLRVAAVRTADCVPILIADRHGRGVAALHAGWRGTAAGIAVKAVARLRAAGVEACDLLAALGPSIGPCCYEVGPEVMEAVTGGSGTHLDLAAANVEQLRSKGVKKDSIFAAPWCTSCEPELFFSFRRDGSASGRLMACIGWASEGDRLTHSPA